MLLPHAANLPEPEPQRRSLGTPSAFVIYSGMAVSAMHGRDAHATLVFQRAIPLALIDVDRPHVDPMIARIPDDLRRRVETHRLAVQQRARKHGGMVAFDPRRRVHEQRERRGVAFGEAVLTEPLDLFE